MRAVTENTLAAVVYCETISAKLCFERGELLAFLKILGINRCGHPCFENTDCSSFYDSAVTIPDC